MEFRIQDALKNLIPGFALFIIGLFILIKSNPSFLSLKTPELLKDLSAVFLVVFLSLIYLVGFFIDALASFLERKILYNWFKRPSYYLFNNKSKYVLARRVDILDYLCLKIRQAPPTYIKESVAKELFNIANELKDNNPSAILKEKVAEYYYAYIFSRNLMVSILISFLYCTVDFIKYGSVISGDMLIPLAIIVIVCFFRWKSRGYYYSRQVLFASYY